jgi:hypothetical protein
VATLRDVGRERILAVNFWGVVMLLVFCAGMLNGLMRMRRRTPPEPEYELSPAEQKARDRWFDRQG